jgi:hypothetical protein
MNHYELLAAASGGALSAEEVENLEKFGVKDTVGFEGYPIEEDELCVCGEPLDDGGNHYDHMSKGY